jgi:serine/threonine-protein kinase
MAGKPATSGWWPTSLYGYKVEQKLGEGAASTIWLVKEPKTGKAYVLKHVNRKTAKDIRYIEQLQIEHEISKQFNHPVLRKSVDLKYTRSLFFKITAAALIEEYFDGTPLQQQPNLPLGRLVDTFIQVGKGLDSLHFLGYVHCDIKPSNILINDKGGVKVIDFGQTAKIATVKERIQGTPDFISPEQVEKRPVTVRTDIFNFGATLYWAAARHRIPTLFNIKKSKREALRDEHIRPPTRYNPEIPEALSDLILECVRLDPTDRPRSMGEVVKGLEGLRSLVK